MGRLQLLIPFELHRKPETKKNMSSFHSLSGFLTLADLANQKVEVKSRSHLFFGETFPSQCVGDKFVGPPCVSVLSKQMGLC